MIERRRHNLIGVTTTHIYNLPHVCPVRVINNEEWLKNYFRKKLTDLVTEAIHVLCDTLVTVSGQIQMYIWTGNCLVSVWRCVSLINLTEN